MRNNQEHAYTFEKLKRKIGFFFSQTDVSTSMENLYTIDGRHVERKQLTTPPFKNGPKKTTLIGLRVLGLSRALRRVLGKNIRYKLN